MGQTLQRAAKWTSAKDGSGGKLEFTPINQDILNAILQFLDGFGGKHPEESKLIFKKALSWQTNLKPSSFSGSGFNERGEDLVSESVNEKTHEPLLSMKRSDGSYEISVSSMELVETILRSSGDAKMKELRACLESNSDPVACICGERFATVAGEDNALFRFFEEITKEIENLARQSKEEGDSDSTQEIVEKKRVLNMRLLLLRLDEQLLNQSIARISSEVRLSPQVVDQEVSNLRKMAGYDDEKYVLEEINYHDTGYIYQNGCRAPPWRQVHGDISYIAVKPHDADMLYITANTSGYHLITGPSGEKKEVDYEKLGDYHKTLVSLLKEKSSKFAEMIDRQEFVIQEEKKDTFAITMGDLNEDEDGEAGHQADVTRKQTDVQSDKDKSQKQRTQKQKKMEPSLKWKALGVEEQREEGEKHETKKVVKKKPARVHGRLKSKTPNDMEDSFSESSEESEEEEEAVERRNETNADLPSEYWQIQKLVKYLKGGNQTATIIALCCMRDFNLAQETCQLAIRDVGGLEVLINLLDTEEIKCKIGALKILKEISRNTQIRRAIADLGGLQTMVKILRDPNKELKCLAAETIANVAKFRRARRTVRQHGGIKKLVGLLDCASLTNLTTQDLEKDVEVARCGALALWSCSKSKKNKDAMQKAGAIPLLAKLLKSTHENMLIPAVGTLQECATEPSYRLATRTEGMVEDLVKNLKTNTPELQMHCASAIFKCAEDQETRDLVRQYGGLDPLVSLLQDNENKELLAAATGAIWKCAISPENVTRFQELKAIDTLVSLLNDQPEEVLVNMVGALGEMAKDPPNRTQIRKAGGIAPLVNLLTGTNQALLVNVTKAVGECAEESENMVIIDRLDGVRLLWSLLKNQNPAVQASAAWAICPCIENAKEKPTPAASTRSVPRRKTVAKPRPTKHSKDSKESKDSKASRLKAIKKQMEASSHAEQKKEEPRIDAGEMVRSFVGGLELIVSLLRSQHKEVLASVCAAIANIAKDEENLAVITDHGVVPMLAKLTNTTDDKLRRHLAEAIARCCNWGNNRVSFGHHHAVAPLVKYLKSKDKQVHRSTARALFQLSKNPENCITMHEAAVVKPLMEMVGAEDEDLQEAAAGCIGNIRRLALANEKAKFS